MLIPLLMVLQVMMAVLMILLVMVVVLMVLLTVEDHNNVSSGGRNRVGLEKQKKPLRNVPGHVELANQESSGILWQTMTSNECCQKAQK